MKYALLTVLNYSPDESGFSKIPILQGSVNDLNMMVNFCKNKLIPNQNITILTDLYRIPESYDCHNVKKCRFPTCDFVCTEILNFIENTIRGIKDGYQSDEIPEVLIYFSCHGSEIKISFPEERNDQAIVLYDRITSLRYLTTKDIFDMLFGRVFISDIGIARIPVYKKIKKIKKINDTNVEISSSEMELLEIQLSKPTETPENNLISYRSSYLTKRGIPPLSKVLIIMDSCHSEIMTHFPFVYFPIHRSFREHCIYNSFVNHVDMPYCVCISSCEIGKLTRSSYSGSDLTKLIFSKFNEKNLQLNFMQFYYHITNSGLSIINSELPIINPIISSTINDVELNLPFFGIENIRKPIKVKRS